jgi:hypothetical protein
MRAYLVATITAAALVLPTIAASAEVDVGPGGVRIGTGHYHRHYYDHHHDHFRGPRPYHHDHDR